MISVLIPVYNVERYLEECLQSVLNQSFRDIEVICLDDGSKDMSGMILDQYAQQDNRIKVIHKANTGYGNNMNVGLDAAAGEYIAIIESDDFADENMLKTLHQAMLQSNADIVKSEYFRFSKNQNKISDRLTEYPKNETFNHETHPEILNMADTIWSCLYRREFLEKNHIRFHETPGASFQDISFALQCWLLAERVYFIDGAFLHYRQDNPDSSMHNPDKIFCVMDEYGWLEDKFRDFWKEHRVLEKYFVSSKYRDYLNHYSRVAGQYQYALLLRIAQELAADRSMDRLDDTCMPPELAQKLQRIHTDANAYYKQTAKTVTDLRIELCSFGNVGAYRRGFLEELAGYPCVMIYGAGIIGKRLADWLIEQEITIDSMVVTELYGEDSYRDIPIRSLEESASECDTGVIIIGVAEKNQYELYQNLRKYQFQHIYRYDDIVRKFMM
jgi:glycosyltransferase involved in cell wall biosynthesis